MRATQVLVALDAVHEVLDRLNHGRIGCWRRECCARLRQFRRLAGRAEQAVMANTLEALGPHVQQEALDEALRRHTEGGFTIAWGQVK